MPRAKTPIDPDMLEKLAAMQCTEAEAASVLKVAQSTLSTRMKTDKVLADAWESGRAYGRASLRRRQYEIAMSDSRAATTMCIWLGKQWLAQADKVEQDIGGKGGTAVKFVAEWGQATVSEAEED